MRILFVTPTPPIATTGSRTRLYNLVKHLASRHDISLLAFVQPGEGDMLATCARYFRTMETVPFAAFPTLNKWQNRLHGWHQILFGVRPRYSTVFPIDRLREPLRRLLSSHHFDVVVLQALYVAELSDEIHGTPVILATENVESEILRRDLGNASSPVHRVRDWLEWRKLKDYECKMVRRFRVLVAVSELDQQKLRAMAPMAEVQLVSNGVDTQAFAPRGSDREDNRILFFGTLNYGPNAEGVLWFCREVLPRVRLQVPNAWLAIVGKDAPERVRDLAAQPGVKHIGFVPDVRPELWSATLSVAPLLSGGGTRLKILEALAAECPVVSTSVGAEGLEVVHGEHMIIADTAEEFSRGVVDLLRDPERRKRIVRNGRALVVQCYDWGPISLELEKACARAVELQ